MKKSDVMEKLEMQIRHCEKCRLYKKATKAVPGEGDINTDIVFIGEAPGANEDKTGRPFVGRAGNLLESLLEEIGLTREEVWIGNIIKHRPPKNRDPKTDEIEACEPYLTIQLRAIKPKLIVTLGRFAMYYFHKSGKISRDHGNLIKVESSKVGENLLVYPVYHPAAGLRNGRFREALEDDFRRIPQILKQIELDEVQYSAAPSQEDLAGQQRLDL